MEWLTSIRTAIDYMEEHLTDDISAQDVADRVHFSPFFLLLLMLFKSRFIDLFVITPTQCRGGS